jgi:aryl-alcohol dehydrogenase-like predicted oxidoreductase
LGVNLIDTADSYGPFVTERLIREALNPYTDDLVIATKGGFTRSGPDGWRPVGRSGYLRQQTELSLRHLGLERIDLYQLHRIDPKVPPAEQLGELVLSSGKARSATSVCPRCRSPRSNRPGALANRQAENVLEYAERENVGFIPWFPIATGELARLGGPFGTVAKEHTASLSQLALAWLLRRSPVILPIPGTSSVAHVENTEAARVTLTDEQYQAHTEAV